MGIKHTQLINMKFKVDNVELGSPLSLNSTKQDYENAWSKSKHQPKTPWYVKSDSETENKEVNYRLEQSSDLPKNAVATSFNNRNLFVESALMAFRDHYPLKITPDIIWITIMQGFARHVDKNAEKFREKFVSHEGKKVIRIFRDSFVKGRVNPWENVFPEFCEKIQENLVNPEIKTLVECNYSTTGEIDKVVSQIALMDTVKNYFDYKVCTQCGIPEIELAGDIDDWMKLRENAEKLMGDFELDFWLQHLLPILDKFVAAFKGDIDTKFWGSIAKLHSTYGSGGSTYLNGWIQDFFPYLKNGTENRCLGSWKAEFNKKPGSEDNSLRRYYATGGMEYSDVPCGLNTAPFEWEYLGQSINMHFIGAISAVVQDQDSLQLEAVTGWGIVEEITSE